MSRGRELQDLENPTALGCSVPSTGKCATKGLRVSNHTSHWMRCLTTDWSIATITMLVTTTSVLNYQCLRQYGFYQFVQTQLQFTGVARMSGQVHHCHFITDPYNGLC